jgi:hypothetical protein
MGVAGTTLSSGRDGVIIDGCIGWDKLCVDTGCTVFGVLDLESERTRRRSTVVSIITVKRYLMQGASRTYIASTPTTEA